MRTADTTSRERFPPAVILAGGRGTRLHALYPHLPKPLAPVLGRPFLFYILEYLRSLGICDITLATGHLAEQIERYCTEWNPPGIRLRWVREDGPLGTGGSLAHAARQAALDGFLLALNGDSLAPFQPLQMQAAAEQGAEAVILAARVPNAGRYGRLECDRDGRLIRFAEKEQGSVAGLVNAGIYLLHRSLLPLAETPLPASLERDYIPAWLRQGRRIQVVSSDGPFIDIGTPESMAEADKFVRDSGLFTPRIFTETS